MILNMQDKDRIQEIAFLIRESYDSYVAAETDSDPIETLKEEWSIKWRKQKKVIQTGTKECNQQILMEGMVDPLSCF